MNGPGEQQAVSSVRRSSKVHSIFAPLVVQEVAASRHSKVRSLPLGHSLAHRLGRDDGYNWNDERYGVASPSSNRRHSPLRLNGHIGLAMGVISPRHDR